jgi:hypothetical protein
MSIVIAMSKIKKRGRPKTGARPMIGFRADSALTKRIDAWAKKQADKPTRGEAIRRLIIESLDRAEADDC